MATITIQQAAQKSASGYTDPVSKGPLANLDTPNNELINLKYPLDLGNDNSKLHYVQFFIHVVDPARYKEFTGGLALPGSGQIIADKATAIGGAAGALVKTAGGSKATVNQTTTVVGQAASIVGNQLINGVSLSSPTSRLKTTIALYMPDGIHSNYSQEYSEFELTSELGKGLNTIRTVDHVLQTANKQSSTSDTMAKALSSDAAVIKAAVDIASGVVGVGPNLGSAILQGRGYAVNPAVQMIYRGATLRSFSLTFIFTPKSQQEAKMVNNIIHTFKYHSLPKLENASQSVVNNLFLVPPSLFEIDFHNGDNSNEYLPRYDKCVLTGMEIDDTPNGWTTHPDGSPVQRTMTLNFRELSILHKDKISENVEKSVYR